MDASLFCNLLIGFDVSFDTEDGFDASAEGDVEGDGDEDDDSSEPGPFTSDYGPVLVLEYAAMDIRAEGGEDDLSIFRIIPGYTFKDIGLQLGANLTYFNLDRPSVEGKVFTEDGCAPTPGDPLAEELPTYTLKPDFTYWGGGPSIALDVELVDDWLGMQFPVNFTFPFTNDSSGWSFDAGAYAYFSFQGLSNGYLDLALMGGGKFGHYDHTADKYEFVENRMMPSVAVMAQF